MKDIRPDEFDLEAIIREFASTDEPEEAVSPEEVPAQESAEQAKEAVEEIIQEAEAQLPATEEAAPEDLTDSITPEEIYPLEFDLPQEYFDEPEPAIFEEEGDTIRLDDMDLPKLTDRAEEDSTAPSLEQTQKIDPAEEAVSMEQTQKVPSAEDAEQEPAPAFVLHPQSNPVKELKKQLTAGPERLYYQLSEKGTGKLTAAIFFNLLLSVLCAVVTVLQAFQVVGAAFSRAVIFGQILAMFLSALLGCNQLIKGGADLGKKQFSLNTLLLFSFLICCADGVFALQGLRVPCCAAFCLAMTFSQLATYHRRSIALGRLDTMRKASRLTGVYAAVQEDGKKVFIRSEGKVADYMDTKDTLSTPDKIQSIYALCVFAVSFLLGAATVFLQGIDFSAGVQVWAVSLLVALPAGSFITATRPTAILERRLHKLGTVLCGWQGLQNARGKAEFPVFFQDLFPEGCAKMNGVKFFGELPPEDVVSYAAALMQATESGLAPLFMQLLDNHGGKMLDADDLQAYDHGIGGVVNGLPVLAGSLSFLRQMGVEADESLYISQSICLAVDGSLCGMFAITYDKNRGAAAGLQTLTSYGNLRAAIVAADPMLTGGFLNKKFGVRTKRLSFPDYPTRQDLRNMQPQTDCAALLLTTKPGLAPAAYGVTGARTARTASLLGTIVQIVGGGVGLAMMAVLVVLGALHLITPVNMFLYQLIWLVPGLLLTEWTRVI